METEVTYESESGVVAETDRNRIQLFPNLKRDHVNLIARLADILPFRDAMLSLRDCIVSRLYIPTEEIIRRQMDPLITVTSERTFFEAFSQDESTYARVSLKKDALDDVEQLSPGCTNIDFSRQLQMGLKEMRSTRPTFLEVEREGFTLIHGGQHRKEERIKLPDSWMHGFLEVQSALRIPAVTLTLHPIDLRNLLSYLKKRKATTSPRSLRFTLKPGEAPSVLVEPWGETFVFRQSTSDVKEQREIKIWGRRRLLLLERVLPSTRRITVLLQGTGMPSFWICDLGNISFLLGLSPWTAREWTGSESYHLFDYGTEVTHYDLDVARAFFQTRHFVPRDELGAHLMMDSPKIESVLNSLCLHGHLLYDAETDGYYAREVFLQNPPEPVAVSKREADAEDLVKQNKVIIESTETGISDGQERITVQGTVQGRSKYKNRCVLNSERRILVGYCECAFFQRFSLHRGPCKHLLALRLSAQKD